jgi:hypothetical protein
MTSTNCRRTSTRFAWVCFLLFWRGCDWWWCCWRARPTVGTGCATIFRMGETASECSNCRKEQVSSTHLFRTFRNFKRPKSSKGDLKNPAIHIFGTTTLVPGLAHGMICLMCIDTCRPFRTNLGIKSEPQRVCSPDKFQPAAYILLS